MDNITFLTAILCLKEMDHGGVHQIAKQLAGTDF
jgi:hypothetical protein